MREHPSIHGGGPFPKLLFGNADVTLAETLCDLCPPNLALEGENTNSRRYGKGANVNKQNDHDETPSMIILIGGFIRSQQAANSNLAEQAMSAILRHVVLEIREDVPYATETFLRLPFRAYMSSMTVNEIWTWGIRALERQLPRSNGCQSGRTPRGCQDREDTLARLTQLLSPPSSKTSPRFAQEDRYVCQGDSNYGYTTLQNVPKDFSSMYLAVSRLSTTRPAAGVFSGLHSYSPEAIVGVGKPRAVSPLYGIQSDLTFVVGLYTSAGSLRQYSWNFCSSPIPAIVKLSPTTIGVQPALQRSE
ncbi:hypothetical protein QBC37DRAFT_401231 [Rhypophila decipiens]|uniref:Uncharacterized protein n=1 Tax=Rhypophila decipiens TaxID=261697 RepID=A0AAN7B755_9PEZI|nr:hypothetical protein QBC37DRAFT_401231 [Rhypophila decipiens]